MRMETLVSNIKDAWNNLSYIVNGHLGFGQPTLASGGVPVPDNIDGVWVVFPTVGVNTDFVVTHNLGRLPSGYIVMYKSVPCDISNGGASLTVVGTSSTITLRSSVNGATVALFVV